MNGCYNRLQMLVPKPTPYKTYIKQARHNYMIILEKYAAPKQAHPPQEINIIEISITI